MLSRLNEQSLRLRTSRLRLDAWSIDDFRLLSSLHSAPSVQAGYPVRPEVWTSEYIEAKLMGFIREQETIGMTKWKMSLHDGTFVGRAGWSAWEERELELGYAVLPEHQGFGYATEAATALLADARTKWSAADLIGFALVSNASSRCVLDKVGMVYEGNRTIEGSANAFYRAI